MTRYRPGLTLLALLAALAIPAGCQRSEKNEPLKVSGKVFIFNYRLASATYVLTLARNGPLPDESFAETRYEDPRGGPPLVTRTKIFPFWEKIALESPPVHCVVKNRPYVISIRIVDAKDRSIQTIETSLTSTLDQTILPARPLVVGPIYTPNPDVFKADGSQDFSPETDCPAPAAKT
ncbi:hypothetical protein [Allorhizobium taibaishanense]|uniref:Uncharacterized protein n=1 Tax=Allorhizobium taibaishanense TaxID=887144 RepID=A0A1Q8ZZ64_9HYPH|nr:hypothetical protein [Allorhizobium taibaishanense]MBB4007484.1 hypothetical protein [Allorhizobium taibaishanense]OLP47566.1 hypothetical protein BJF91_03950 [Allorhizobium taibaishanense]